METMDMISLIIILLWNHHHLIAQLCHCSLIHTRLPWTPHVLNHIPSLYHILTAYSVVLFLVSVAYPPPAHSTGLTSSDSVYDMSAYNRAQTMYPYTDNQGVWAQGYANMTDVSQSSPDSLSTSGKEWIRS